jgi:hypothetical protein
MRIETDDQGKEYEFDDTGRCVRVRVPKFMMDAAKPPANDRAAELDHYREIGQAFGHYGVLSDEQRARVSDARDEYIARTSNAWRREERRFSHVANPADGKPKRDAAPDRESACAAYCNRVTNA